MKFLIGVGVGIGLSCIATGLADPNAIATVANSEEARINLMAAGISMLVLVPIVGGIIASHFRYMRVSRGRSSTGASP